MLTRTVLDTVIFPRERDINKSMIQFDPKHQEIVFPVALVNMIYKIAKEGHPQIYNFRRCSRPGRHPFLSRANKKMGNIFQYLNLTEVAPNRTMYMEMVIPSLKQCGSCCFIGIFYIESQWKIIKKTLHTGVLNKDCGIFKNPGNIFKGLRSLS